MELKPIPISVSIFLDADEALKFRKTIDDFLNNARRYIESVQDKSRPHEFEIKSGEIRYPGRDSNDRLTYLLYDDEHVVAGVTETRTRFNNLRYTFFRNLSCLEKTTLQ